MGPAEFSQLINRFYTISTKIITKEDGLVEKLAGDAVAAFWGAGFAGPNYVQRTLEVAQSLSNAMTRQAIPVGVGVHSGIAYFGAMGAADGLMDISAIGDEVNVAARLASKAAAGEIIVSEHALKQTTIDGSQLEFAQPGAKGDQRASSCARAAQRSSMIAVRFCPYHRSRGWESAQVLTGGKRDGLVYYPTVLAGVTPDMKVVAERSIRARCIPSSLLMILKKLSSRQTRRNTGYR